MVHVVDNMLFVMDQAFITDSVHQPLHYGGLGPASIILLCRHAFIDLNSDFLFSFVIKTHHNLAESSTIKLLYDFISIGNVISDYHFVKAPVSIEAEVVSLVHAIASSI